MTRISIAAQYGGIGFCLEHQADVPLTANGRCQTHGTLAIPPSFGKRIIFPNPALANGWASRTSHPRGRYDGRPISRCVRV